jgi:iron complex outermembrane receptor protein
MVMRPWPVRNATTLFLGEDMMNMGNVRRESVRLSAALLATSAMTATALLSAPAMAQNNQAEVEATAQQEAIIITGSRIARKDYTATSPIVTVDADLIEKSASINLEANLNKLPQFSPALSQFTAGDVQANANNTLGASTVSLRQLGSNRNLVLVDGRRPTPVNGAGVADLNAIPSSAVDRVEIISGGASSTYGADAVGGVVNFILKKNFEGLNVDGQASTTERGDGFEYRVAFLMGANIGDGRGNVMMGAERYSRDLVRRKDRPWYQDAWENRDINGSQQFLTQNFVSFIGGNGNPTQACYTAYFKGGTCGGQTFTAKTDYNTGQPVAQTFNGVPLPILNTNSLYINGDGQSFFTNTTTRVNGVYVPELFGYTGPVDGVRRKVTSVGLLADNNVDEILSSSQNRWTFFAKGHYELSDHITVFGQTTFARTQVPSLLFFSPAINGFAAAIPHGDGIYLGDPNTGIPSSVVGGNSSMTAAQLAVLPTNLDYLAKGVAGANGLGTGRYGLSCAAYGGCTMSQAFPVPEALATLLNNRTGANVVYNNVSYAPQNAPFLASVSTDQFGWRRTNNYTNTFQVMAGLEGTIPGTDLSWDVTASHGETVAKSNQTGFLSGQRWRSVISAPNYGYNSQFFANAALPGARFNGGSASCATGVNPFVTQTWSADCLAAVTVDTQNENRLQQDMIEANIQGGMFDLPYGQARFALGATYRKNSIDYTPDSSATEGASFYDTVNGIFPQGHTKGSTSVKELYGEVFVPLLRDLPFAKAVNLEIGYRLSDYDTIGSIGTYKFNGEWAVTEWFRFRGGYQKASRAPNLGELFTSSTQIFTFNSDGDACSRGNITSPVGFTNYSANPIGQTSDLAPNAADTFGNADAAKVEALCRQLMGTDGATQYYRAGRTYSTAGNFLTVQLSGNRDLKAETANTFTIGAVISLPFDSPWLRRLRLSVDYYNLKLKDGISQQSPDVPSRFCFSKLYNPNYEVNAACRQLVRDPSTGEPGLIQISYSNLGKVETDGIDVQLDWGVTFRDVGIPIPGSFTENIQFSYLNHFKTTTDQNVLALVDYAGTLGGGEVGTSAGSYRWRLLANFGYSVGPFRLSVQWQHKPKVEASAKATDANSQLTGAKPYNLFSLSGNVSVTRAATIRFGIDNLFDTWPQFGGVNRAAVIANGQLPGGSYNASQYDVLGRRFYLGASYKF